MEASTKGAGTAEASSLVSAITPQLCRRLHVRLLYLFGSHARGEALETSDVDFAVQFEASTSQDVRQAQEELIAELMAALQRNDVGVVVLEEASALLKHRIVTEGILVHEAHKGAHADLYVKALREYDDTRSLREATRKSLKPA